MTLDNPDPDADDRFGHSVAIDGGIAVVGADLDDTIVPDAGSVYVFDVTNGNLLNTLNDPNPSPSKDYFGSSVAVYGDTVVVGAYADDAGQTFTSNDIIFPNSSYDSGAAYLYDLNTEGTTEPTTELEHPDPQASDRFGSSVATTDTYAVIGDWQDDINIPGVGDYNDGSAYVFDVATGNRLFRLDNPTPESGDFFGASVAISGNIAVVGAYSDDTGATNAGSAYIFDVTTGVLLQTLSNPTPGAFDGFGGSVSISGNTVLIGARGAGEAYVYELDPNNLTQSTLIATLINPGADETDLFGSTVAVSGDIAVVGAEGDDTGALDAGSVYIFDVATGDLLQTLNNPDPDVADLFGTSVAASGDTIIVGAQTDISRSDGAGTAYIYSSAVVSVPEVSATGALAAFGSLLAMMAFLWERRRLADLVG
ncbi:hypothetical protein [Sulfitobacter sp. JL08]|uniref:hypothetical protein n=1 Tax=Sulfitobacter sp. JL08 TaxID=2070369 RepID=UPI0013B42AAA|nr:hypothetical protein [Sulfitobacter sp. JL08]